MTGQSKLIDCAVCRSKVEDLRRHIRTKHTFSTLCLFCSAETCSVGGLLRHLKISHAHLLGYLPPRSDIVKKMEKIEYPINITTIKEEIRRKGISDLGGTWIEDDEYFTSWDEENMRPVLVVELLTKASLEVSYNEGRSEFPYIQDDALPTTQSQVDALRSSDRNVSHLAVSAQHRLSKEQNDKTFRVRNLVKLFASVNTGLLSSVESHLTQVATNWWKCLLVTVPIYDNRTRVEGQLPEPSHIFKFMFLGDEQIQVFRVKNSPDLNVRATNFVATRSDLEEFNTRTGLNIRTQLPLSWSFPVWKCSKCRFMSDDLHECKLHERFDKKRYCPVHRISHGKQYPTWDLYKAHVEAAGRKECDVLGCDKWFYNQSDLNSHHSGVHCEKDVECTFEGCDKKFKTNREMQRHLLTHKVERERLPCQFCDSTYFTKPELNAHIKLKHRQASTTSPNRVNTRHSNKKSQSKSTQKQQDQTQDPLARTQDQLAQTQDQLAQTQDQLARTQDQLAQTQDQLALAQRENANLKLQLKRKKSSQPMSGSSRNVQKKKKTS